MRTREYRLRASSRCARGFRSAASTNRETSASGSTPAYVMPLPDRIDRNSTRLEAFMVIPLRGRRCGDRLCEQGARDDGDPEREQIRDDLVDAQGVERDQHGARADGNAQLRDDMQHPTPVCHEITGDGGSDAAYDRKRNNPSRQQEAESSERPALRFQR